MSLVVEAIDASQVLCEHRKPMLVFGRRGVNLCDLDFFLQKFLIRTIG